MKTLLKLALLAFAACQAPAHADTFPQRAITIVDAYPAGGSTDVLSRILGERISKRTGQPVIVEARAGAAGTIGSAFVSRARPDGYTILVSNPGPGAIAATAFSKLPYDVETGFAPLTIAATLPMLLCVPTDSKIRTPAELIALGKSSTPVNFGSAGTGGMSHIVGEMFNRAAGTHFLHVPYKGANPLTVAVIAGEVEVGVMSGADARPHVRGGKMRCIANAGAKRSPLFPDVPTLAEAGLAAVQAEVWFGYLAPAGTPRPVVERLHAELTHALAEPAVREKLEELSMTVSASTPEEFAARIQADRKMYGEIVKAMNLQLD